MPFTKWCFLAGALALVGVPPFAGFFSKDPIIASTLNIGWYGYIFYACGIAGAFLTGLYTFRLWFLVFPGEPSPFVREHYHDRQQEVYFLHAGRVEMEFGDGATQTLEAGAIARVDPSTVRRIRNVGDVDAVYVVVGGADGYVGRDGQVPSEDEERYRATP